MIHHDIQGVPVPALGFGTWDLRGDDCRTGVMDALALGYRHIDTAQGYDNERFVGEGIRRSGVPRDAIFLVSKVQPGRYRGDDAGVSTRESLAALGTDYLDLMLLHWPNPGVPLEEPLQSLMALQRAGLIRHIGVSNFPPSWVDRALAVTDIFCNQVEYNPYLSQDAVLAQARAHGMLVPGYCPIARAQVARDPVIQRIAARHDKTATQVTLRWLVQQDNVAAIPKAASPEHRRSNLDIFDFALTAEEMRVIGGLDRGQRLVKQKLPFDWER